MHSAGHILGSAQIRIESNHTVCVVSGDYKRVQDQSCEPFDLQQCDIFVTESTFGLPIYNWEAPEKTMNEILKWWEDNKARGYASVLFCYALGKAQRLLSLLPHFIDEPVFVHGAILSLADLYAKRGISLGKYLPISENKQGNVSQSLILAPPSAKGSPWMKRFFPYKTGWVSGWMQVRGTRKRRNVDRGFPLSDHADWQGLLKTVEETQASLILTTHGNAPILARYLQEQKRKAYSLAGTEWLDEGEN